VELLEVLTPEYGDVSVDETTRLTLSKNCLVIYCCLNVSTNALMADISNTMSVSW